MPTKYSILTNQPWFDCFVSNLNCIQFGMWNMIVFNIFGRIDGCARERAPTTLKKNGNTKLLWMLHWVTKLSACKPRIVCLLPRDEEAIHREVQWTGQVPITTQSLCPTRACIPWLLPDGFCTPCHQHLIHQDACKMHIHGPYQSFTELDSLGFKPRNLHFAPCDLVIICPFSRNIFNYLDSQLWLVYWANWFPVHSWIGFSWPVDIMWKR